MIHRTGAAAASSGLASPKETIGTAAGISTLGNHSASGYSPGIYALDSFHALGHFPQPHLRLIPEGPHTR
jgi:hypothetical protein